METTLEPKTKIKIVDMHVIALDETKYWREDIAKACGVIKRVYMFDRNEQTHCCELTPSYFLYPLYSFASNEISDEMDDKLRSGDNSSLEGMYVHVSNIDKMNPMQKGFTHHLDGGLRYTKSGGKKYHQIIEAAIEYFSGNCPI